jgi:hypothetical protein
MQRISSTITILCFWTIGFLFIVNTGEAALTTQAARELGKTIMKKFGKEANNETAETIGEKTLLLSKKYGDDAVDAVKKVGPSAFRYADEAGENEWAVVKLMAKHGDKAIWIVKQEKRLAVFVKYGDDAVEAMIKHGNNADTLVDALGKPATTALTKISKHNWRRLTQMQTDGELSKIGQTDKLLAVIEQHGDRAMDFIWKNKGSLTVTTALTAFLMNPEPFINGTQKLTQTTIRDTLKPITLALINKFNAVIFTLVVIGIVGWIFRRRIWRVVTLRSKI